MSEGKIDLAHVAEFRLGVLDVHPALRQLVRDDGAEQVIEPRMMQVLVALARANGGVLTRDELTRRCWEGRVVGEDAINRVISRLRRVAEGIAQDSFRIETLTKVGYRLIEGAAAPVAQQIAAPRRLSRRTLLNAGLAVSATGALGGGWLWWQGSPAQGDAPPPEVAALVAQAQTTMSQGTADGIAQAIGLLRRVTEIRPDYADGWGILALAYAHSARGGPAEDEAPARSRAADAIRHALAIDPYSPYALAARGALLPQRGHWREAEAGLRKGLERRPDASFLVSSLGGMMASVGRMAEAAALFERAWKTAPPNPGLAYTRTQTLWAAGRLDDADRALAEALSLFPNHFAVWFTNVYLLMYTGRPAQAVAFAENRAGRPPGIPEWNFEQVIAIARALSSRAPDQMAEAARLALEGAHKGAGFAENAMHFLSALGQVDQAFLVADAYYFGRGWETGDLRFSTEQKVHTRHDSRRTHLLFFPSTAPMRADPRFTRLCDELGLSRYWRETGTKPDYRAA